MLAVRFYLFVSFILIMVSPALANTWIGRDNGSTQCGCAEGRTLDEDQQSLADSGVTTLEGCTGRLRDVAYCRACCICSNGVFNFFLIDEEDLPIAEEDGWQDFDVTAFSCPKSGI